MRAGPPHAAGVGAARPAPAAPEAGPPGTAPAIAPGGNEGRGLLGASPAKRGRSQDVTAPDSEAVSFDLGRLFGERPANLRQLFARLQRLVRGRRAFSFYFF